MTDGGTARGTEVQNLLAWLDVNMVHAAENTSSELATEGVPYAVLDLGALYAAFDRNALLAINRLSGDEVLGDQHALLALRDENARMFVRLDDNVGSAPCTTPATCTATATACTTSTSSSTAASSTVTAALCNTSAAAYKGMS